MQWQVSGSRKAGYILAFVSAAGTGVSTVIGKWNLEAMSSLTMNALIFTVAMIAMTVFWLPIHGVRRTFVHSGQAWFWIAAVGTSSAVAVWFYWAGVQAMDPSLAGFLNRSEVPLTILMGVLFLGERFNRWEVLGAAFAIGGILIMRATLRMEYSAGFWLVLAGAGLFAVSEFVSKIALRYVEAAVLTYTRNGIMCLLYWAAFLANGNTLEGFDRVWLGVVVLGLLGPGFNRLTYLMALKRIELSKVSVIGQSQPVYTVVVAAMALGMVPTPREVIGGICLIMGCVMMVLFRRRLNRSGTASEGKNSR